MSTIQDRKAKVLRDRSWVGVAFEQLKKDDIVALYEPDDSLVGIFDACGDAYLGDEGIWTVAASPIVDSNNKISVDK